MASSGSIQPNPANQATRPIVVPIPLHPRKLKQRGYNQAELLAEGFCQVTGLPLHRQGLVRVRATDAQFSLSSQDRAKNLADAFQLGASLKRLSQARSQARSQTTVLLLDDIYTTGATVQSALATLHRHQMPCLGVAVLARAQRHSPANSD